MNAECAISEVAVACFSPSPRIAICILDVVNVNDDPVAIASHVANQPVLEVTIDQIAPGMHPVADGVFRIMLHHNTLRTRSARPSSAASAFSVCVETFGSAYCGRDSSAVQYQLISNYYLLSP